MAAPSATDSRTRPPSALSKGGWEKAGGRSRFPARRFRTEQHLRRPGEIRAVREQGRRLDCQAFTLWWRRREEPAPAGARVCVIASTAAVGAATRRNRAKRRLREV